MEQVSRDITVNEKELQKILGDCQDIVFRKLRLGKEPGVRALALFTEPTAGNMQNSLGETLVMLATESKDEVMDRIRTQRLGMLDVAEIPDISGAVSGLLSGDVMLFVEGYDKALKIPDKGYPGLGVTEANAEKGLRGSDESFSDSIKTNASLLRKRLRTPQLKLQEYRVGTRSNTLTYVMYMDGIADQKLLQRIQNRLQQYDIDRVLDSGVEQQLITDQGKSPFPQIQSTRRPSFAAEELMEGRIVLMFDNSPEVLLLPCGFQNFLMAADDSFLNYQIVSMIRILRYLACVFAMIFPALYIVACSFENQLIPTDLLLAIRRAAQDVPFGATMEILLMEVSFELLREAGVRIPGDMGNAFGIVGGLIIGSAAVEAQIVSPIVVIVVAFTALCSFSIPSEELTQSLRVLKFGFIVLCSFLGTVGLWCGLMAVTVHLASLTSLGEPFLTKVQYTLRKPMPEMKYRGVYGRRQNPVRLRRKS